jgi:DNA polymerase III delta subunit
MSLHLVYGSDEYRRTKTLAHLRETYLIGDFTALNHHILKAPTLNQLLEAVTTASFSLMGQPVIEVHHFYALHEAESNKARLEQLLEALSEGAETRHILFVSEKADKKLKFTKELMKHPQCHVDEFKVPVFWDADTAYQLLQQECHALAVAIAPEALRLLIEHLGHELAVLVPECQKLFLYTKGRMVTVADVRQVSQLNQDNFHLIEQWLNSKVEATVFQDLKALLSHTAPLPFIALMTTMLNYHYRIKRGLALGLSFDEIARQEGKKTYPLQKDAGKLRHATLHSLEEKRIQLMKAETAIKSGREIDVHVLESLLVGAVY